MGRHRRYLAAGAYYHVGTKGNNDDPIFRDDRDRAVFAPDPEARPPPLPVALARPLPARQSLPPARRDAARKPVGRDARPERSVRPCLQRAPRQEEPRLRPTLLVQGGRVRRAVRKDPRLHPPQPRPPRVRPPSRPVAVGVGARGRSDRFGPCRTTPTS